jgi:hypothetical protein
MKFQCFEIDIKIAQFSVPTANEFKAAAARLLQSGMKKLVLDLRGNGGGTMETAIQIADEFLPAKRVILSSKGLHSAEKKYPSTAGGLLENIPRILPNGLHAHVDADAWQQPRLMAFLQAQGHIEPEEMARTFNCGIGMAIVVAPADVADVTAALESAGETVFNIGHIADGEKGCTVTGSLETWSAKADWTATYNG